MSVEENKAVVRAFGDAMNRKDASFMGAHPGLVDSKAFFQQLFVAFPDMHGTEETTVAADDWVTSRQSVSGTMQGPFMGMAPTGKHGTWEVINMFRLADGKIVEYHGQADVMGMMQQLGVSPASAPSPQ